MIIADTMSGGFLIGVIIAGALGGVCLLVFVGSVFSAVRASSRGNYYNQDERIAVAIGSFVLLLIIAAIWLAASWPLKYDYHHWVVKSGVVEKVGSRFISQNESMSQRYVLVIHGQPYGVDDTRASLVNVGDLVTLECKKEHQYFHRYSDDGWACRWRNNNNA